LSSSERKNAINSYLTELSLLAKLLIDNGFVTKQEFDVKLFSERASYEGLLQRVGGASV